MTDPKISAEDNAARNPHTMSNGGIRLVIKELLKGVKTCEEAERLFYARFFPVPKYTISFSFGWFNIVLWKMDALESETSATSNDPESESISSEEDKRLIKFAFNAYSHTEGYLPS